MPGPRDKKPGPRSVGEMPTTKIERPMDAPFDASAEAAAFEGGPRAEAPTVEVRPLKVSDVFQDSTSPSVRRARVDEQVTQVDATGERAVVQHVARLSRLRAELVDAARMLDAVPSPEARARAKSVRDAVAVIDALVDVVDR